MITLITVNISLLLLKKVIFIQIIMYQYHNIDIYKNTIMIIIDIIEKLVLPNT